MVNEMALATGERKTTVPATQGASAEPLIQSMTIRAPWTSRFKSIQSWQKFRQSDRQTCRFLVRRALSVAL